MAYIGTSPSNGVRRKHTYTATANQTSFSGNDDNGISLVYTDTEYLDVYQNGVKLVAVSDYASTTGTSVVLTQGASVSDIIEIIAFDVFSVADTVSASDGGSFGGNVGVGGTLSVTGASTLTGALSAKGGAVFNEDSADVDFRVESNTRDNAFFVDGATGNIGIGVTPEVYVSSAHAIDMGNYGGILEQDEMNITSNVYLNTSSSLRYKVTDEAAMYKQSASGKHIFSTAPSGSADAEITFTTAMTILNTSQILVGSLTSSNSSSETLQVYKNGNPALSVARQQDGTLVHLRVGAVNGAAHGSISISGVTCSYNAFSGSHWSRLSDNSKPTILKGTIIETIDEMCDWYQAEFTVPATDEEDEYVRSEPIGLPSGKSVGDTITHTYEGTDYTATIVKEGDEKHVKCKISDTADSKRVYGVHMAWDADDDTVNDMYVTAVGTHVVRINGSITVQAGDLLSSNGDGTAKVQDDDIIRSKTIGKVLTNIKQETYSDGSYTVPCALYCG